MHTTGGFWVSFVEYEKMMYLDSDIQVYENLDELLENPDGHLYAVIDCFCEKTWSHTPQYQIGYCQHRPDLVQWPSQLAPLPPFTSTPACSSLTPAPHTCKSLLHSLKVTVPTTFAQPVDYTIIYIYIHTRLKFNSEHWLLH